MQVYISTPVSSRLEPTLQGKTEAARERCDRLKEIVVSTFGEDVQPVTVFDLYQGNDIYNHTDAEIMGRCVQAVLESDMLILDTDSIYHGMYSRGCHTEYDVAARYGKQLRHVCKDDIL